MSKDQQKVKQYSVSMNISIKDAVLFRIQSFINSSQLTKQQEEELAKVYRVINEGVEKIKLVTEKKKIVGVELTPREGYEEAIKSQYVELTLERVFDIPLSKKKGTIIIRQSMPLVNSQLKYPKHKLSNDTDLKEGLSTSVDLSQLSGSESKVVDCFTMLLHENSINTTDPKKEDTFYTGVGLELVEYEKHEDYGPKIEFSVFELAKHYTSKDRPSGKEMQNVLSVLRSLESKRFLMEYTLVAREGRTTKKKSMKYYSQLFTIVETQDEEYIDSVLISSKKKLSVILAPIFRANIQSTYLKKTDDNLRRLMRAYGSPQLPIYIQKLDMELIRSLSNKRKNKGVYEITAIKLYEKIGLGKYLREGRKKLVSQYWDRAVEVMKKKGLLIKVEEGTNKAGDLKYIFHLNIEWIES